MPSQTANLALSSCPSRFGGQVQTYLWQWQGHTIAIAYESLGDGEPVLLLPAFSTVSTRAELHDLAIQLATRFRVIALDWPGFGDSARLPLDYGPALYHQFLEDFVQASFTKPIAIAAAGHAAGYALRLANSLPAACDRIALIAPTWRGPLAVMGVPPTIRSGVKTLVRSPLAGQVLYGLNTRPAFLKWMYRRHVFVDETKLTPSYIHQRYQGTQQPGARYAPAAFVTGSLDPAQTSEAFLSYFQDLAIPLMVVVAEQAPPSSKADMKAMAALPQLQSAHLPGTLGMAEEYGNEVAAVILRFLQGIPAF